MRPPVPIMAIGRSRLLYDAVARLAALGHPVKAIVTDRAYAEYDVGVSDFADLADRLEAEFVPTSKPEGGLTAVVADLVARHQIRAAISVNWQFILPAGLLDLFPAGVLNLHIGRLPDYKGNATANWAILNGEPDVFIDVHRMEPALDAGVILARDVVGLDSETYVGDVLSEAASRAPDLFARALAAIASNPDFSVAPNGPEGLRCYPRLPDDGAIDWHQPAEHVLRLIRASSRPYPGAYTFLEGRRLTIWRARAAADAEPFLAVPGHVVALDRSAATARVACGRGAIELVEIEDEGGATSPVDLIRGIRARLTNSSPLSQGK